MIVASRGSFSHKLGWIQDGSCPVCWSLIGFKVFGSSGHGVRNTAGLHLRCKTPLLEASCSSCLAASSCMRPVYRDRMRTRRKNNDIALRLRLVRGTIIDRVKLRFVKPESSNLYDEVRVLCLFIGYPRSGHSLVGSVIDAHQNALISHRLDAVRYLQAGFSLPQVFYMMHRNAERFALSNRELTGYSYAMGIRWREGIDPLFVIGDQEGKNTARRLSRRPHDLEALLAMEDVSVRFIHVIRNPYDTITTWSERSRVGLRLTVRRYFDLCAAVQTVRQSVPASQILDLRHEVFVSDFNHQARLLGCFLEIPVSPAYVGRCSRIVDPNFHESRWRRAWPEDLIASVTEGIQRFDFLSGYSFEE